MLSRWVTCHRVVATFAACSCGWMNWIRMNSAPAATAASPAACSNALGVMVGRDQLIALLLRLRVEKGGVATDGSAPGPRSTRVTETNGRPVSRTSYSSPCSAAWSTTGPSSRLVPSLRRVRVSPLNHPDHRSAR